MKHKRQQNIKHEVHWESDMLLHNARVSSICGQPDPLIREMIFEFWAFRA